ncbi:MAG: hypothetical protein ABFS23_08105 [Pseudomonadota bacterium]
MTGIESLVEQHAREFEARLRHIDELLERAKEHVSTSPEEHEATRSLAELLEERDRLAVYLDDLKLSSRDNWRAEELSRSGPMGVWDALAQAAERLVERFEKK